MKTTMKTLAGPDTIRIMLVASKDGQKQCEIDITHMMSEEVAEQIDLQEYQGRTCEYKTIKNYTFPDFDRGEEG